MSRFLLEDTLGRWDYDVLAEKHDSETGLHFKRVSEYTSLLVEEMGMPGSFVEDMRTFAPLHDIGKAGTPGSILLAARRLTPGEFEIIKTRTTIGHVILKDRPTLELAADIAYTHHERFDGSGYPRGLTGSDIPFSGRILALVDVYDALRTRRPYKESWPHERVVKHITAERGKHFAPEVVEAFLALADTFENVSVTFRDSEVLPPE